MEIVWSKLAYEHFLEILISPKLVSIFESFRVLGDDLKLLKNKISDTNARNDTSEMTTMKKESFFGNSSTYATESYTSVSIRMMPSDSKNVNKA